jgi:AAA+ ATPase superfamily predicted ATPase
MFVDREEILSKLIEEYNHPSFRFTILYGRRRVGKTTLLKKYIENRPHIYYLVTLESMPLVLRRFQRIVAEQTGDKLLAELTFENFEQLFAYIARQPSQEKRIIAIDEFQYLGKIDHSIPSQFQRIVDEILADTNIHLILCGSIISMMYEQTLSYTSPLYGRRTSSFKLDALEYRYLEAFFPGTSEIERIELYAVLYGVPKYLEFFSYEGDIFRSIERYILDRHAFLYDEPRYILQNEVSEPITYFSILEVIASGEHKIGNIAGKLGKNVQNITSFIAKLIDLEILYKEIPVTEAHPHKSKKGLYFIKDNFFRFWFTYVLPYKSQLEMGNSAYALQKIKESFSEYVSKSYEELAISYVQTRYNPLKCGRWWNKDTEIDLVAVFESWLMVGECKYSNKKVGTDILVSLIEKSKRIDCDLPVKCYILFSKSGFTDALIERAKSEGNILLVEGLTLLVGNDETCIGPEPFHRIEKEAADA